MLARSGPLSIAAADYPAGSSPNGWGPVIQFTHPFTYQGGPMLLEIAYSGMPAGDQQNVDNVCCSTVGSQSGYGGANGIATTTADGGLFQDLIVVEYTYQDP